MAGNEGNGVVVINWYSTVFRSDRFETAVTDIAPVALRYGATEWRVYRARDDIYKFMQMANFERKYDWERYWYGEEFVQWRADYTSWYQVPVVPQWQDLVGSGGADPQHAGRSEPEPLDVPPAGGTPSPTLG